MFEDMDGYWCFKIVDRDLEKMKEAGQKIWEAVYRTKQVIIAEVRVKE